MSILETYSAKPLVGTALVLGTLPLFVNYFKRKAVDVNAQSTGDKTILLLSAVEQGHARVVERLLEAGADSNMTDQEGYDAFYMAEKFAPY